MNDQGQPTKPWRRYTPCGCMLLMLVVGITLPAIGWMVWSANAARLIEEELAKLREANEPIELADLDVFYAIPPNEIDNTQLWVDVAEAFEITSYREARQGLPIIGDGLEIPPADETWEQLEEVEAFLADYSDEMSKIHRATAQGGYARFDRDYQQ